MMNQQIVRALPTERIQYERWYQLGLPAVLAVNTTLAQLQATSATGEVSAFPAFTLVCAIHQGLQQLTAIKTAVAALKVIPQTVSISQQQVALTFGLQWSQTGQPTWHPTAARTLRLYDGLLTNLLGTPFQPITAIQVAVADWLPVGTSAGASTVTKPVSVQPTFQNYGIQGSTTLIKVVQVPVETVTASATDRTVVPATDKVITFPQAVVAK